MERADALRRFACPISTGHYQRSLVFNAKRGIGPETALRLARYFGNSTWFWMNLQARFDLAVAERELGDRIAAEVSAAT